MGAILFLTEGVTDVMTLESPLRSLFLREGEERSLFFHAANGDLTSKGSSRTKSTRDYIKKEVMGFLTETKLRPSDLELIVETTDLDASFARRDAYVQSEEVSRQTYVPEEGRAYVEDAEGLFQMRKQKGENLLFLVEGRTLWLKREKIPHLICYFSINLEHALYDEPNCRSHEKKELAFRFEEKYADDPDAFLSLLKRLGKGRGDYLSSWGEALLKDTAFQRGSNLYQGVRILLGEAPLPA